MDVRVRLVFADAVKHHIQRRCGFSSCWYLLPNDMKIVGDLAHALLREFGLQKRCPQGLELTLEELPVLASQSIRLVRDNDTIVVQCPVSLMREEGEEEREGVQDSETSSLEGGNVKNQKLLKRKARGKTDKESRVKKVKVVESAMKGWKKRQGVEKESRVKRVVEKRRAVKKKSSSESSSSSSSLSSSSSSSSSSESISSESEDEPTSRCNQKTAGKLVALGKQELGDGNGVAGKKASASREVTSKTSTSASGLNGKAPRRRRRRLRQRGGRQKSAAKEDGIADSSADVATLPGDTSLQRERVANASKQLKQAVRTETQSGNSVADVRGYPRAKAHILFDEVTGDQVEVKCDEVQCDVRDGRWISRKPQTPELAKYGPPSSNSLPPRAACGNQDKAARSSVSLVNRSEDASKGAGKSKYEERWKRPYKIVATVLDKRSEQSNRNDSLTALLNSYPTAAAASFRFVPTDVVAYKTLTLCVDTWQPVLSEWRCGQVQSMDVQGTAVEMSAWTLAIADGSIVFDEAIHTEQQSVQASEINDLRFLSGPSYSSLRNVNDEQNASKTTDGTEQVVSQK